MQTARGFPLHPYLTQHQRYSAEHHRRDLILILSRDIGPVDAIFEMQALQRPAVRVKQPVIGYAKFAVPFAFGLAIVKFMAGADGLNDEFGRDAQSAIAKGASAFPGALNGALLLHLRLRKKHGIHHRNPDLIDHQIDLERELAGNGSLLQLPFNLPHQPAQRQASVEIGRWHFGQYPFNDFVSAAMPKPLDAWIIEIVFRPPGRARRESAKRRDGQCHRGESYRTRLIAWYRGC